MTTRNHQQANLEGDKGTDDQGPPAKKIWPAAMVESPEVVASCMELVETEVNTYEQSSGCETTLNEKLAKLIEAGR